jgi:hypothetical protein
MYSSRQPDSIFTNHGTEVVQQSSHVMQLPPYKPLRKKIINIDTRFQYSDTGYGSEDGGAVYNVVLPQRITEVESLEVKTMEVPVSFFNFSSSLKNTYFSVLNSSGTLLHSILISDGNYSSIADLVSSVNTALISSDLSMSIISYGGDQTAEGLVRITNHHGSTIQLAFDVDSNGSKDKNQFKGKLGWALGFRLNRYTLAPGASITSESFTNLNTVRYLFLALQENPGQGVPSSFVCPIFQYYINKDILARVSVDYYHFPFGSVISANPTNGYLLSDERKYSPGKVSLQNLQVQLLNEFGNPVALHGHDFSFVLEVKHF